MARYINSIVFVGDRFPVELFDEHELFGRNLDKENQVKLGGQFAQFSYGEGKYKFTVMQNRIDLAHNGPHVLPNILVESAKIVAKKIDSVRPMIQINGVGMNCDVVFDRQSINKDGISYCSNLIRPQFAKLVGATPSNNPLPMGKIVFTDEVMRYQVRIEPDSGSRGKNLFVAINGHQVVRKGERTRLKLEHFSAFKAYVQKSHQRIIGFRRGV